MKKKLLFIAALFFCFVAINIDAQSIWFSNPTNGQIVTSADYGSTQTTIPLNLSYNHTQFGIYGGYVKLNPAPNAWQQSNLGDGIAQWFYLTAGTYTWTLELYAYNKVGESSFIAQTTITFYVKHTISVSNNFGAGTINIDGISSSSGSKAYKATSDNLLVGAIDQQSGSYYRVWNQSGVYNSEWEKKLMNASFQQIPGGTPRDYNYTVASNDNGAEIQGVLRNRCSISRNDQTEFDGTIAMSDVTQIVEQNSGTVPADPTKTVGSRNYNFAGWANGGNGSYTPQDNSTYPYNALYKTTHYSNQSSSFMNNNQSKIVRTSNGYLHLVYESMGYIFYERSTNGGTSWQLMNDGKSLSHNEGKHPAITVNGTEVYIVFQEKDGTSSKVMLYACSYSYCSLLEVESSESYATKNLTPVIALGDYGDVMIVWKRTTISGSKDEGLYYKYGHLSNGSFTLYTGGEGNLAAMIDPMYGEVNGLSLNPTIDVTKSVTYPAQNVFHIAWQQPSGNYSHINYSKIDVGTGHTLSSTTDVEDVSSGSGYQYNYAPSISLSTSNVVNVAWAAMLYYPTGSRKVMTRTRTTSWSSYFGQYGNSVYSPSIACYGSSSIVAWSETNGSGYSDKFLKWGSVHTAPTTGRDLQIYNTSALQDMRIVSFSNTALPYSFAQSSDLYNLNKENPLAMRSGVQVVVAQEKTEFYFRIGDISFNGQNIAFKDINLNTTNLSQNDLDYLMTSDVVNLSSADNLSYAIEYGATDTVKASSLLQNDKFISFNVELIDASNDAVLYTLNNVKFTGSSSLSLSSESYNIDLTGLTGKEVYFKVKIANNLNPVYYASEIKSDANVLGKSKAVTIDLSKTFVVKDYDLFQNYPNPFNPATTITYQLPKSGSVTLKIYDMLGKEVMTLVNEHKEMGRYTVQFDASSLASGMYVYQLRANDYISTKKMLLLK
ncbi:MAG: hypothetical protein A2057_06185 [Ignavibacteria bacterium GWA2_35_9]|nr:MAG: hypothetical protein A2057_06185 [Ignavibacteria bacterium GWA2_35_9]